MSISIVKTPPLQENKPVHSQIQFHFKVWLYSIFSTPDLKETKETKCLFLEDFETLVSMKKKKKIIIFILLMSSLNDFTKKQFPKYATAAKELEQKS